MSRSIAMCFAWWVACCTAEAGVEPHSQERYEGSAIIEWNQLAYEIAFAEDQFTTFKGQRALAMMHLAQHDALNSIVRRFETYQSKRRVSNADPIAATAQAGREVLLAEYPSARAQIDALLMQQLATTSTDFRKRELGIRLGREIASNIMESRRSDGWDVEGTYAFVTTPGAYQTTPEWQGFVVHPGLAAARPFLLKSAGQFHLASPPALSGIEYARAFREAKLLGSRTSVTRTADQTAYAIWWMEFSEGLVNRFARRVADEKKLELWKSARLFALLNAALVDTYVAVWKSKYDFNHWRPYTAIRQAAQDGNPATRVDANWDSLRPAPPFPEYVSAHAAGCACTFTILERELAMRGPFRLDSITAPTDMPTRTFNSLRAAADECADSRVQIGFHFRYSTEAGSRLGRRIAKYAIDHHLQALHRRDLTEHSSPP